jgi:septal ring factor EnvC (AmiA/AmiB activator)
MASRCSDPVRLKPDATGFAPDASESVRQSALVASHVRIGVSVASASNTSVASAFRRTTSVASAFRRTVATALVAVALPVTAQQADRARTEALARRAGERLQVLQREAERLASQESTLLNDLRKLEVERQLKGEELKQLDAEAARVGAELTATTERMEALQKSEAAERPELRARVVEIYKLGRARYLRLLLSTPDLRRIGQASRTVAAMAKLDRDRIASHQRTLAELKSVRATLQERQKAVTTVRAAAEKAQAAAQRAAQARSDLIRDIDRRRDLNAQLAGELQAAQTKLQLALRDIAGGTPPADVASLPLKPFRGDLDWPVRGQVKRRFSGGTSKGIEIAANEGADAVAVHDGLVAFAGTFSGFGNLVILDHGSQTFSLYGDLLEIAVKKGAHMDRGQPVGSVGPTPSGSAGLYFELRIDGQPVDPLQWLKKR